MRALVVVLVACHSHAKPPPPLANADSTVSQRACEVTLSRTECLGTCPVYTVAIHPDGSIDWRGTEFVAARGARHGHVVPDGVERLARAIDKVQFFELDRHGRVPRPTGCIRRGNKTECDFADIVICTDTPSSTVTVTCGGRSHTTVNDHCLRAPVEVLEDEIDDVANTKQWIKAP